MDGWMEQGKHILRYLGEKIIHSTNTVKVINIQDLHSNSENF